jgi:hypothetical protein
MVKIRIQGGDTLKLSFLNKLLINIEKAFSPNADRDQFKSSKDSKQTKAVETNL